MTYTYTTPSKSLPQTRTAHSPYEAIRWTYGEGGANVRPMCGVPLNHIQIIWIISLFHIWLLFSVSSEGKKYIMMIFLLIFMSYGQF